MKKIVNLFITCFYIISILSQIDVKAQTPQMSIYEKNGKFTHVQMPNKSCISHEITDTMSLSTLELGADKNFIFNIADIDSLRFSYPSLPVLSLTFPDYPEAEQVWTKEDYIKAILNVEGNGIVADSYDIELKVKNRGNTTSQYKKKPMRFKLDNKTSICDFRKSKNYVLLANYIDPTHCKNAIALWLANKLGTKFCNTFLPCDVFINGKYTGLYLLTEKIGI